MDRLQLPKLTAINEEGGQIRLHFEVAEIPWKLQLETAIRMLGPLLTICIENWVTEAPNPFIKGYRKDKGWIVQNILMGRRNRYSLLNGI